MHSTEKVLNIFIRVNSGGTILSYSDLLLSIATAQWKTKDAREEITKFVDGINSIGEEFDFDKDFVLKNCLVLPDIKDIAFKVDNFNVFNMKKIENSWQDIAEAIRLSVELISGFGYNYKTLTSANAVIPISYYISKLGNPKNFAQTSNCRKDREKISKWFRLSLIKRAFSGQPDNVIRPIRKIIKENHDGFPFEARARANHILNRWNSCSSNNSFCCSRNCHKEKKQIAGRAPHPFPIFFFRLSKLNQVE